ncbi:MAG: glycosyltransferase [Chitinophagaceae bacterium]|nr:glycosyltransferase [Chitinophagaceae bacterium]
MNAKKTKLLIFCDWYAPAFKAGGPIRSIVNFVDRFKDHYDIHIFTSDRDINEKKPFKHIEADQWLERDGCHIWYYSPGTMTYKKVKSVIAEINPNKIYLNSMFSNMIKPIVAAYISGRLIIAPRGMLRRSALAVKPIKKFMYLKMIKLMGLAPYLSFHSTGEDETKDIQRFFPKAKRIVLAPNLPVAVNKNLGTAEKAPGKLRIVFVGRLHPIKKLDFLLEALAKNRGDITLDIVATREDAEYWRKCKKLISKMQFKIDINNYIDLPHAKIKPLLENANLFVLPTEGENFGHAIFEALAVGCPVLISDQTPWRNLQSKKAGMDLPLSDLSGFTKAIQTFVDMGDAEWQEYRNGALALAQDYENNLEALAQYNQLFENAE